MNNKLSSTLIVATVIIVPTTIILLSQTAIHSAVNQSQSWLFPSLLIIGFVINIVILILIYYGLDKILKYFGLSPIFRTRPKKINNSSDFNKYIENLLSEELSHLDLPLIKSQLDKVLNDLGLSIEDKSLINNQASYLFKTPEKQKEASEEKETTEQKLYQIFSQIRKLVDDQNQLIVEFKSFSEKKIDEISKLSQQLLSISNREDSSQSFQLNQSSDNLTLTKSEISSDVMELVKEFNISNIEYFRDPRFIPLALTKQSIQGDFDSTFSRIIQLAISSDSSQESYYLKVEINGENWLIPNIISRYKNQIMSQLDQNSEIFIIHPGSDNLKLIKPAKLKNPNPETWEIEEPGEFTQQQ